MRFIIQLLIVFSLGCGISQNLSSNKSKYINAKTDANKFIDETKEIMQILKIGIRDSIKYDGFLKTIISDSLYSWKKDFGIFFPDSNLVGVIDTLDMSTRIYAYPIVNIAKNLDSIIYEQKDTSKFYETYARSIIVHELVHYLQNTSHRIGTYNRQKLSRPEYVNLPDEKEAFAVSNYYLFKHLDSSKINMLMTFPFVKSKEELWELFIDAGEQEFSNSPPIYNKYKLISQ